MRSYLFMHPYYAGVMMEEQSVPAALPDAISWVFTVSRSHSPIVWGKALQRTLTNSPVRKVDVMISDMDGFVAEVTRRFGCRVVDDFDFPENKSVKTFKYKEVRYNLHGFGREASIARYLMRAKTVTSVEAFYCKDGKEICGSRVSFADLGSMQARFLADCSQFDLGNKRTLAERAERKRRLIRAGFDFIDFPTLPVLDPAKTELR
jgi:hypothetical protein